MDKKKNVKSLLKKVNGSNNTNLYKIGDIFWVRLRKSGRTLQKTLGTKSISEARIKRDLEIASFLGKKASFQGGDLVCDKFEEWINLMSVKSEGTINSIKSQWNVHLKSYFGGLHLDEITESEWLRYVTKKRETLPSRKFFNDRKYLSMFLNWCHREGFIEKLPKLSNVDPETKAGKVFSKEEVDALILHANMDLQLQILMALTMGMRVGEILSLEWNQIDFVHNVIHLPAHKTKIRKARTFKVSDICLNELKFKKLKSTSSFVFPSPKDPAQSVGKGGNKTAWKNCKEAAKVTGRFHDLRHTFLTNAFRAEPNAALICHFAGLSLEEAQKTYLHFTIEDTLKIANIVTTETLK